MTHKNYKRLGIKMAINKESVALNVINESLKLPFVKVDRSDFLTKIFINNNRWYAKIIQGRLRRTQKVNVKYFSWLSGHLSVFYRWMAT